jgi:hypothetical protein
MQAENVLELLRETTPHILEQVAFVFAEPSDEAAPFSGDVVEADIDFNGPLVGQLRLTTSRTCAATLAASVLGVDADDPAAIAYTSDVLGETLNMLCGAVLLQLFGAVDSTHSGTPTVSVRSAASATTVGETVSFVTDEGHRIDAGAVWRKKEP